MHSRGTDGWQSPVRASTNGQHTSHLRPVTRNRRSRRDVPLRHGISLRQGVPLRRRAPPSRGFPRPYPTDNSTNGVKFPLVGGPKFFRRREPRGGCPAGVGDFSVVPAPFLHRRKTRKIPGKRQQPGSGDQALARVQCTTDSPSAKCNWLRPKRVERARASLARTRADLASSFGSQVV
jgi:hypothetical protein